MRVLLKAAFMDDLQYSTEPVSLPESDGTFDLVR